MVLNFLPVNFYLQVFLKAQFWDPYLFHINDFTVDPKSNPKLFRIVICFLYAAKDVNLSENESSNNLEDIAPFCLSFYRV